MLPREEFIEPVGKRKNASQRCKQGILRCGRLAMFPSGPITAVPTTVALVPLLTRSTCVFSPFTRLLFISILLMTILCSFSTLTLLFSSLPLTSSVGLPGTLSP